MREEIIVSGRMNELIDPHLQVWNWEIPAYLFLGGLAAGILFFAGLMTLQGKEKEFETTIKRAPLFTPLMLGIGLLFLFLDLKHKLYFWQLYTTIKLESPMSWGAWTLLIIMPVSVAWAGMYIKTIFSNFKWPYPNIAEAFEWISKQKTILAWIMVITSVILGIYTGILLSAFNARPLWNTSILGPLFLTSGLSTGAAFIMILSKDEHERHALARIDLLLIAIELFLIIHMFMGFRASTQVQIEAANMFLGGTYTAIFWTFVVVLGLVLPAALEIMSLKKLKVPYYIAPALVLMGGLILRFIMVYAGQMSRWLY